jgi:hypothetical protein
MPVDMLLAISHGCGILSYQRNRRECLKTQEVREPPGMAAGVDIMKENSCLEICRLP